MNEDFSYVDKLTWVVQRLNSARIPYAIGGALALGYYVPQPRATHDIDINIFCPAVLWMSCFWLSIHTSL
jgi:hypothetical protein